MSSLANDSKQYRYGFFQLAAKDALVFKSIVSLLSGRSSINWLYADEFQPDVLVVGHEAQAGAVPPQVQVVLHLGMASSLGEDGSQTRLTLSWPLRANEIFDRLEKAADILRRKQPSAAGVLLSPQNTIHTAKLLRWPTNSILTSDPGYMRLAALLSARAFAAPELASHSGLSLETCVEFLNILEQQGCLEFSEAIVEPAAVVSNASTPVKGFVARLRAHLGLTRLRSET